MITLIKHDYYIGILKESNPFHIYETFLVFSPSSPLQHYILHIYIYISINLSIMDVMMSLTS